LKLFLLLGHPKFPKNGYVRFCDEMRLQICKENPTMDPVEVTKVVAAKWHGLSAEKKKPYNDQFKADSERFKIELKEFEEKQKELGEVAENVESVEKVPKKKKKRTKSSVVAAPKPAPAPTPVPAKTPVQAPASAVSKVIPKKKEEEVPKAFITSNCELPIFTDAFLEHNKQIESELKSSRKLNSELNLENSVLMKHIENMENGVTKVEGEIFSTKQQNAQLEKYLTKLKCILASGLNSVQLPVIKTGASVENITEYMQELSSPATVQKVPAVVNKAREILRKIDIK
jgi:high mobility group protein 20A